MKPIEQIKKWLLNEITFEVLPKYRDIGKSYSMQPYETEVIKKVWNNGNGLIQFILKTDSEVIVNELFVNKKEREMLKDIPNVKFVSLGYPDYYTKGLSSFIDK